MGQRSMAHQVGQSRLNTWGGTGSEGAMQGEFREYAGCGLLQTTNLVISAFMLEPKGRARAQSP